MRRLALACLVLGLFHAARANVLVEVCALPAGASTCESVVFFSFGESTEEAINATLVVSGIPFELTATLYLTGKCQGTVRVVSDDVDNVTNILTVSPEVYQRSYPSQGNTILVSTRCSDPSTRFVVVPSDDRCEITHDPHIDFWKLHISIEWQNWLVLGICAFVSLLALLIGCLIARRKLRD